MKGSEGYQADAPGAVELRVHPLNNP